MEWSAAEFYTCLLHFGPLRQPKTLSCGHSFCSDCLKEQLLIRVASVQLQRYKNCKTDGAQTTCNNHVITCAVCAKMTSLTDGGVAALTTDVHKTEVKTVETLRRLSGTERDARVCDFCKQRKERRARRKLAFADHFCPDCRRTICSHCHDKHCRKCRAVMLIPLITVVGLNLCYHHGNETARFYCQTCRLVLCNVCALTSHKGGHYVVHIADKNRILEIKRRTEDTVRDVRLKKEELLKSIEELDALLKPQNHTDLRLNGEVDGCGVQQLRDTGRRRRQPSSVTQAVTQTAPPHAQAAVSTSSLKEEHAATNAALLCDDKSAIYREQLSYYADAMERLERFSKARISSQQGLYYGLSFYFEMLSCCLHLLRSLPQLDLSELDLEALSNQAEKAGATLLPKEAAVVALGATDNEASGFELTSHTSSTNPKDKRTASEDNADIESTRSNSSGSAAPSIPHKAIPAAAEASPSRFSHAVRDATTTAAAPASDAAPIDAAVDAAVAPITQRFDDIALNSDEFDDENMNGIYTAERHEEELNKISRKLSLRVVSSAVHDLWQSFRRGDKSSSKRSPFPLSSDVTELAEAAMKEPLPAESDETLLSSLQITINSLDKQNGCIDSGSIVGDDSVIGEAAKAVRNTVGTAPGAEPNITLNSELTKEKAASPGAMPCGAHLPEISHETQIVKSDKKTGAEQESGGGSMPLSNSAARRRALPPSPLPPQHGNKRANESEAVLIRRGLGSNHRFLSVDGDSDVALGNDPQLNSRRIEAEVTSPAAAHYTDSTFKAVKQVAAELRSETLSEQTPNLWPMCNGQHNDNDDNDISRDTRLISLNSDSLQSSNGLLQKQEVLKREDAPPIPEKQPNNIRKKQALSSLHVAKEVNVVYSTEVWIHEDNCDDANIINSAKPDADLVVAHSNCHAAPERAADLMTQNEMKESASDHDGNSVTYSTQHSTASDYSDPFDELEKAGTVDVSAIDNTANKENIKKNISDDDDDGDKNKTPNRALSFNYGLPFRRSTIRKTDTKKRRLQRQTVAISDFSTDEKEELEDAIATATPAKQTSPQFPRSVSDVNLKSKSHDLQHRNTLNRQHSVSAAAQLEKRRLSLNINSINGHAAAATASTPRLVWRVQGSIAETQAMVQYPTDVRFVNKNNFVITDPAKKKLLLFNLQTFRSQTLTSDTSSFSCDVNRKSSVALIALLDARLSCVKLFSDKGDSLATIALPGLGMPRGVAFAPDNLICVSDVTSRRVTVTSPQCQTLNSFGEQQGFAHPQHLRTDAGGRLLVSDSLRHCVHVCDLHGRVLRRLGSGSGQGELRRPHGLCVDRRSGHILVCDHDNDRISMFNERFQFVCHLLTGIQGPLAVDTHERTDATQVVVTWHDLDKGQTGFDVYSFPRFDRQMEKSV